ncbi:cytochrome C oxidase subunit IV family protein [Brevibacillus daliensis]|uniref:cytochrome C oxidase subunit IV family protein n=1 Tax=Brevibacillus daliensis TaxID=2892995 RepID=UPI001E365290|nr:cytochrome C oxidase subunit IV family protein [Brevibacillus daliensis]
MAQHNHTSQPVKKVHANHHSMKPHIVSFILSLMLTALAFAAVIYLPEQKGFVYPYIVFLGIVQALVQLYVWMHLKDKGHLFPVMGIFTGVIIVFTCIVMALYWV